MSQTIQTPDIDEEIDEDIEIPNMWALVVHNDDVNSFENVIFTLMEVCGHTMEQASQCTMIIHNKGKCSVKVGDLEEMNLMCEKVISRGITASVELN
jgi:ATP-dependent Clp protease adaptor protein ClpS